MQKALQTTIVVGVILPVSMATIVDLTHTYGKDVLYPPAGPNGTSDMFNFTIIHRGYEPSLDAWLEINWIGLFEHGGTHMDAPAHYAQGRAHLNEVPSEQFFGPGVMIDTTQQAKTDPDYLMTIKDIEDWESVHGQIPTGAIVMMNTGKHKHYPNRKLFYGTDTPGDMSTYHNPGIHPTAARWLMHNRHIKAFGTDAHSPDPGQNNHRNRAHEEFLPNGVLILEFVANLDMMPATGSRIFVGAIKMRDGSGGPVRIFAIYGEDAVASNSAKVRVGLVVYILLSVCLAIIL